MFARLILLICVAGCLEPFPIYDDYLPDADAAIATLSDQTELECNGMPILRTQTNGQPCQNRAFGICLASGTWQCRESGLTCQIDNPRSPQEEICPRSAGEVGLDEDCDGRVDETCGGCAEGTQQACYPDLTQRRGIGACTLGTQVCGANGEYGECEGAGMPTDELCDGLDNDCDGLADEGNGRSNDGTFACNSECGDGIATCIDGQLINCSAGSPESETCNGVDDDCDGNVDESPTDLAGQCTIMPAVKSCSIGRYTCLEGNRICELDPSAPCACQPLSAVSERHYLCGDSLDAGRAAEMCNTYNFGTLLQIETASENLAVFHALKSFNFGSNVWLGGTRDGDTVRWVSGSSGDQTLVNPEDVLSAGAGRNRVEMDVRTGLWNFRAITASRPFICEQYCNANDDDNDGFSDCNGDCNDNDDEVHPGRPEHVGDGIDNNCNALIDETTSEICNDGADNNGDNAIDEQPCLRDCSPMWFDQRTALVCTASQSWDQAKSFCNQTQSRLAEFKTQQSWRQIWAWLALDHTPSKDDYWHGLRRVDSGRFQFVGGETIDGSSPSWTSWTPGQPDDYQRREDCAELWYSNYNGFTGTWNDNACWSSRRFICLAPQ